MHQDCPASAQAQLPRPLAGAATSGCAHLRILLFCSGCGCRLVPGLHGGMQPRLPLLVDQLRQRWGLWWGGRLLTLHRRLLVL